MKNYILPVLCLLSITAFGQMQLDNKIQLTGNGANAKIEGVDEIVNNNDAANKIYVDTAIANRTGSGPLACPSGYIAVNNLYCIENVERGPNTFWDAAADCGDENAYLCSVADWIAACRHTSMTGKTGNQEWVDGAQGNNATWMPDGSNNCQGYAQYNDPVYSRTYRCCIPR